MARTPAERAAVDWASVIADAQNGITADHHITTSTTDGPSMSGWRHAVRLVQHLAPDAAVHHRLGDMSGSYAAWIAQPLGARGSGGQNFFMVTPDLRFPQGDTRAAQQADFTISRARSRRSTTILQALLREPAGRQRPVRRSGLGLVELRLRALPRRGSRRVTPAARRNGNTPFFVKAELDMLQAEGLYRQGNYAAAVALVNITRAKNGLAADHGVRRHVAGAGPAATCVPKVPQAPNFNTVGCGNLLEAIKYEKRIETAYTHFAPWYLDERGWGDLPANTPIFWAIPYQDLQARG